MLSPKELKRYEHHIGLPGFGVEKQELLKSSSVLIVGAGGLGCPVLLYLAAAGVGKIGIVDHDAVGLSNLQRQVIYTTKDIGRKKVIAAAEKINEMNPHVEVKTWCEKLDNRNALDIIAGFDIIADCSDNMPTRYMVNDACVLAGKTLISGSVFRFEGQVMALNCPLDKNRRSADYRIIFPEAGNQKDELDCATAGVLSVVPGIVGCMQANEIITHLTAGNASVTPQLISVNVNGPEVKRLNMPDLTSVKQNGPATREEFLNWKYSADSCAQNQFLNPEELAKAMNADPRPLLIDVRMPNEYPEADGLPAINIPLPVLEKSLRDLSDAKRIIVFCKSGARSEKALDLLKKQFPSKEISSLKGGVEAWNDFCEKTGLLTGS